MRACRDTKCLSVNKHTDQSKSVSCTLLSRSKKSRSGHTKDRVEKRLPLRGRKSVIIRTTLDVLRKTKGFQVCVREGFSLGSITVISCVRLMCKPLRIKENRFTTEVDLPEKDLGHIQHTCETLTTPDRDPHSNPP